MSLHYRVKTMIHDEVIKLQRNVLITPTLDFFGKVTWQKDIIIIMIIIIAKETPKHESDGDTNCNQCARYSHLMISKRSRRLGNRRTRVKTIQTAALLRLARILRGSWRLPETCCHSNLNERPSALAYVKNFQKRNNNKSKNGKRSRGWSEGSLFNSYYTEVNGRTLLLFLDCSILPLIYTL